MLQASWGRSGKQQQEQNSPNLEHRLLLISVQCILSMEHLRRDMTLISEPSPRILNPAAAVQRTVNHPSRRHVVSLSFEGDRDRQPRCEGTPCMILGAAWPRRTHLGFNRDSLSPVWSHFRRSLRCNGAGRAVMLELRLAILEVYCTAVNYCLLTHFYQ